MYLVAPVVSVEADAEGGDEEGHARDDERADPHLRRYGTVAKDEEP